MKLKMQPRPAEKKSENKRFRREGKIPAIIYIDEKPSEPIVIERDEFLAALRQLQSGRLPTTVFALSDGKGKDRRALIKEIQYHPTTYQVIHIDFEELHDKVPIKVKVPIECVGVAECPGIKLGGILRQVMRHLRVRCLPKDIPQVIEVDIRQMNLGQKKRLADIEVPSNVSPMANLNEVAIVIGRR